jgi:hypothetical protein
LPDAVEPKHQLTAKGPTVSNIKLPFLRNDNVDGKKRLWRIVPVATITAAAVGAVLIGGVAGPARATSHVPAQSAWSSIASGEDAKMAVNRYVTVSDGRYSFNSAAAERAGVSTQTVSAESEIVAGLNKGLAHDSTTAGSTGMSGFKSVLADTKDQDAASSQSTTITLVPGFTITISNTGIVVNISKADVTELESVASFAKDLLAVFAALGVATAIAAAIVAAFNLPAAALTGPIVAAAITFVGAAIGIASDVLKVCTAADGTATFTVPWFGLPSCSAQ